MDEGAPDNHIQRLRVLSALSGDAEIDLLERREALPANERDVLLPDAERAVSWHQHLWQERFSHRNRYLQGSVLGDVLQIPIPHDREDESQEPWYPDSSFIFRHHRITQSYWDRRYRNTQFERRDRQLEEIQEVADHPQVALQYPASLGRAWWLRALQDSVGIVREAVGVSGLPPFFDYETQYQWRQYAEGALRWHRPTYDPVNVGLWLRFALDILADLGFGIESQEATDFLREAILSGFTTGPGRRVVAVIARAWVSYNIHYFDFPSIDRTRDLLLETLALLEDFCFTLARRIQGNTLANTDPRRTEITQRYFLTPFVSNDIRNTWSPDGIQGIDFPSGRERQVADFIQLDQDLPREPSQGARYPPEDIIRPPRVDEVPDDIGLHLHGWPTRAQRDPPPIVPPVDPAINRAVPEHVINAQPEGFNPPGAA